jgi:DNA sulfur modification protein DndD
MDFISFLSIEIFNYRQYKNIKLQFEKKEYDVHLIVASNGVGKTNLLNAINWCLYGDEPHVSGSNITIDTSLNKLPICNIKALDERKYSDEETCPVSVSIVAEDNDNKYVFERSIDVNVITRNQVGKDRFGVKKVNSKGEVVFLDDDSALELINRFLPKSIREYFYFDGERLLNYFDNSTSKSANIKDSIYEISQVNVIDKVESHLNEFIKKYSKKIKKLSPELEKKGAIYEDLLEKVKNKKMEIEELKVQIQKSKEQIKLKNDFINGTESVVEDNIRYNQNKDRILFLEEKLETANFELIKFVRYYSKLLFLYDCNLNTSKYINKHTSNSNVNPVISMGLIKDSLEEHKCRICGSELNDSAEEYLEKLVNTVNSNKTVEKMFEIKNDIKRSLVIENYENDKEKCFKDISIIKDEISDLEDQNYNLDAKISKVSQIEDISDAIEIRAHHEELLERNIGKLGSCKENLNELEKNLKKSKIDYDYEVSKNQEVEENKQYYKFVEKAQQIIVEIKKEIVDEVKEQMQIETIDIFEQLLWKKDTFERIELDDNFNLKLFHKQTNESCLNSCSAAEKELLALAFTLALHKVSGYDNLLFIDTPVGRVSDNNRENFAKVLLNVSKNKQIILAFTPSEYSAEVAKILEQNVVSSCYHLQNDEVSAVLQL